MSDFTVTTGNSRALLDVLAERKRQDAKWGGPAHDDEHTRDEWVTFVHERVHRLQFSSDLRSRRLFVEIAALAISAIESGDRKS